MLNFKQIAFDLKEVIINDETSEKISAWIEGFKEGKKVQEPSLKTQIAQELYRQLLQKGNFQPKSKEALLTKFLLFCAETKLWVYDQLKEEIDQFNQELRKDLLTAYLNLLGAPQDDFVINLIEKNEKITEKYQHFGSKISPPLIKTFTEIKKKFGQGSLGFWWSVYADKKTGFIRFCLKKLFDVSNVPNIEILKALEILKEYENVKIELNFSSFSEVFQVIEKLKELKNHLILDLSFTRLDDDRLKALVEGIENLIGLRVGNNEDITGEGIDWTKPKKLMEADFSNTSLTDQALEKIKNVKTLKFLRVRNCLYITSDAIRKLRRNIPETIIIDD